MSGIAGCLGTRTESLDAASIGRALSFTGLERVDEVCREGFFGLAVIHEEEAARCPAALEKDDICILLDGYITGIDGTSFDPARPGDTLSLCTELFRSEGADFARRLNGSFNLAILDRKAEALHLICDRMASRYLYFMRGDGAPAFASRLEALQAMGLEPTRRLNHQGFVELMVYGRLLASEMWAGVESVPPASVVSFSRGEVKSRTYWDLRYTYDRETAGLEENAERLAGALRETMERSTAGFAEVGLLLSGGLDSRTILACLPEDAICYTACDRPNPETWIAGRAARLRGCRRLLLERTPYHYFEILPGAARVCEGAYAYMHAHMENLLGGTGEVSGGILMTGFMFNILLRAETLTLHEKHTEAGAFYPPTLPHYRDEAEVERDFLRLVAVQTKGLDVLSARLRREAGSYLRHSIRAFMDGCSGQVATMLDFFELYGFKQTRTWRHAPMLFSIRNNHSERCPALDNSLLDIMLTTPTQQRFGSRLQKRALFILDRRMLRLCDSNTLLPASAGPRLRAAKPLKRLYDRLNVHVGRRTIYRHVPVWTLSSGSWQNMALFWRYGPLAEHLEGLLGDEAAMRDGVIEPSAVRVLLDQHRRGVSYHTEPLTRLLTFLEWRSTTP